MVSASRTARRNPASSYSVPRYSWHSACSLGWPFPMLRYKCIFQVKYTEATLSNSTRKLSWFEITKRWLQFKKKNYRVIYYNFRHTFVPIYWSTRLRSVKKLLEGDAQSHTHCHEWQMSREGWYGGKCPRFAEMRDGTTYGLQLPTILFIHRRHSSSRSSAVVSTLTTLNRRDYESYE